MNLTTPSSHTFSKTMWKGGQKDMQDRIVAAIKDLLKDIEIPSAMRDGIQIVLDVVKLVEIEE